MDPPRFIAIHGFRSRSGGMGYPPTEGGKLVSILWIVIVILAVIGLFALLGRGRFWGTRRY